MNPPAGESVCPLCGDTNECGVAAGKTTCWCFATPIPAEVLARVPADQRNRACICARCASGGGKAARPPHGIIALLIACVLLTSVTLSAQAGRGVVTGVVRDRAGGVLPGTVITLSGVAEPRTTTTAADGQYRITDLPPGVYRIQAELAGFRRAPTETVTVVAGGRAEQDFSLRIGLLSIADYIVPFADARETLRKADAVLHLRVVETMGVRILPPCECMIGTEHVAHVVAALKGTASGSAPTATVTFHQEQAGEWSEDGRIHRGQYAPYRAGDEFVAMLRRDEAGRLIELVGPHLMFRVVSGRVAVPRHFRDRETGLLQENMAAGDFVAAIRKLLQG